MNISISSRCAATKTMRLKTLAKNGSIIGTINYADEPMSARSFSLTSAELPGSNNRSIRRATTRGEVQAAINEYRERAFSTRLPHASLSGTERPSQQHTGAQRDHSRDTDRLSSRHHRPSRAYPSYQDESELQFSMRSVLRELMAVSPLEDDTNHYEENESFFPSPKATFMIDRPKVKCAICREKPLEMLVSPRSIRDKDMAILPCGHAACHGCLSTWLEGHSTCPFCRLEHRHRECGHAVAPRTISHKTILSLPATICKGGTIAGRCSDCRRKQLHAAARRYKERRGDWDHAQVLVETSATSRSSALAEARAQVTQARSEFLRVVSDAEMVDSHRAW
jgi:hypothetical protein